MDDNFPVIGRNEFPVIGRNEFPVIGRNEFPVIGRNELNKRPKNKRTKQTKNNNNNNKKGLNLTRCDTHFRCKQQEAGILNWTDAPRPQISAASTVTWDIMRQLINPLALYNS